MATPWNGKAPLEYTEDYFLPEDLDAAFARWRAEYPGGPSQMWHRWVADPDMTLGAHSLAIFSAAVSTDSEDVGSWELRCQANCARCGWHWIAETENGAVEAWHDHAMPGWRELPILPSHLQHFDTDRDMAAVRGWMSANYPSEALISGVPVLTLRSSPGTRHVPRRSPMGGYDICMTSEGTK